SSSSTQEVPVCGAGASWHEGWIVFTDNNANGVYEPPVEQLWEQHAALPSDVTVNAGGNANTAVRFRALGTVPGFNTTFQICDDRKAASQHQQSMRQVVLAFSGRAQVREGIGATPCK
ncbi:MAG: GspH/FimT family protein, partial [Oceanococcaceae bacterium]